MVNGKDIVKGIQPVQIMLHLHCFDAVYLGVWNVVYCVNLYGYFKSSVMESSSNWD